MGSHENSGCREEKIRDGQRDSDRDRLCLEDAVVFIRLPAYSVFSSPPAPPPLYILYHFSFPAWENSCAAAAILNYIGQWEIVFVYLLLFYVQNSSLLKQKRQWESVNISTGHICYYKHTHSCNVFLCYWCGEKQQIMMQTNRTLHANEPW